MCRVVVIVGLAPLAVLQPIALSISETWSASHADEFKSWFTVEAPVCLCFAAVILLGSHRAGRALAESRLVRFQLEEHALQTQGLLEAAMPRVVARQLLDGTPPEALARSFPAAAIAFVSLADYAEKAQAAAGNPGELLAWLDAVYVAFDALVDRYGDRVNKLETVRVSPKLPLHLS